MEVIGRSCHVVLSDPRWSRRRDGAGGLQVDRQGNPANWMVPAWGGMDLVTGARRVIVAMEPAPVMVSCVCRRSVRCC